jgi:hypothetical protein
MKKLLLITAVLALMIPGGSFVASSKVERSPHLLQLTELLFSDVQAIAAGIYKGQERFYVFHSNSLVIYDGQGGVISQIETGFHSSPGDPVIDDRGNLYLINSAKDEVGMISPGGQWYGSFKPHERPFSLAALGNGNIVIASPNHGKLLHIYDNSGRKLQSFGDIKVFDGKDYVQNHFLNRGKVVVDPSDNIYFIFKYAPVPTALKFSKKGKLISEFPIEGRAIDLQVELARKHLSSRPMNDIGGFVITNSAAVDPTTGHLWICMNGSSKSGVVYEYSPKGKKLREYSFITDIPSIAPRALTYVTDIIVKSPSVYIIVDNGVYAVSLNKAYSPGELVFQQEACPPEHIWPGCSIPCPQGSCPGSYDCKAILDDQIPEGRRIVASTCLALAAGQGTPPKPNGGCIATVTTCNTNTGDQVTHSTNKDCNPVKYKCMGSACVVDCNGTFTTANCNNTCAGGGGGGGGVLEGECDVWPPPDGCDPCMDWDYSRCKCVWSCSPILIDTDGNGFQLTDAQGGVLFDLNADGTLDRLAWTMAGLDDAWLALDRNGNGLIDNGRELFGNFTPQPQSQSPNGFLALAEYDKASNGGNLDGRINSQDTIFASLRLWLDANQNGVSEAVELHTLSSKGIAVIELDYKESRRRDNHGNEFRYRAKVQTVGGVHAGRWAWDVFLVAGD